MSGYGVCTNPSLWMGDLEPYMDEAFIRSAFQAMSHTVFSVKFLTDKKTGLPAGYCFVNFGEIAHAKKAHLECNGRRIPLSSNKRFKLNYALTGSGYKETASQSPSGATDFSLHVSNLTPDVTDVQLFEYFAGRFKSVKHATIVKDGTTSRGYGFVRFYVESDVLEAIRTSNGAAGLGQKPIRVGKAVPKDTTKSYNTGMGGAGNYSQYYQQQPPPPLQQQYPQYGGNYGGYYDQYKIPDNTAAPTPSDAVETKTPDESGDAAAMATEEDDDPLEDPEVTVDVDQLNRAILDKNEEFYQALEASRWQFVDTVTMTYDDLCKA